MKIGILSKILISTVLLTVASCSGSSKQSRKPVSQIKIENKANKMIWGQTLQFSVSSKLYNGELDNTKVFINDSLISTEKEIEFNCTVDKVNLVGKNIIKVVCTNSDGSQGINYKTFEVLSDIIPQQYSYQVVKTFSHNTKHFTQGLEIQDDFLYESTGENGTSGIYKMNLETGKILNSVALDEKYFGEGITILNQSIYQLTYKAQKGFVYNLNTFEQTATFGFESKEGWGMTNNGTHLIMSDGTNILTFIDPVSFKTVKKIQVYNHKGEVQFLNELEYDQGFIYANIYTTDMIVKIDARTGRILDEIDLRGLLGTYNTNERIDVLNGIAINRKNGKFYVTGKLWPKLFEIKLIKKG